MTPAVKRAVVSTLRVESLSKRFGGLQVFDGIDLELRPGSVLGVIGPNGAGKTTLINVISGMLAPTAGKVFAAGTEITGKPLHVVSALGVVRSFQQTNTFRSATVGENLDRASRFGARSDEGDVGLAHLLRDFGLERHLDDTSGDLPYGLQKMLGLLMALAIRPKYLLLDEPAAGLERGERPLVDHFVKHACSVLGCGVLIVEHDMDLVRRLCPQILVLEAGRVLATGAPADVLMRRDVVEAYMGASEVETC